MGLVDDENCIVFTRGGVVENRHIVHAAVVDATGKLLYSVGDPTRLTLIRSAAKPAQALAILETGACEKFAFEDADVALMCASHSAEIKHAARAFGMLLKAGFEEKDLRCGGHASINEKVNAEWIKADWEPTPIVNNCSGKHAGMLAGAKVLGVSTDDYHELEHPMQARVKQVFEDLCGLRPEEIKWTVDGCNLPAPGIPLDHLAKTYAMFAAAPDGQAVGGISPERMKTMSRIFTAMAENPHLVAGSGRFCTLLTQAFGNQLIGKVGADGCYGIGIRSGDLTKHLGADGAIGIAVKIEDGNLDVLYAAAADILEKLQVGSPETRSKFSQFHDINRRNTAGAVVGSVEYPFVLRKTGEHTTNGHH